ncbi:hypothetical protein [Sulfurisphaera ohwakuensis]|uniref:Uncharacterized protein n=1 Tax=Sulfurisphaera ohwakuensis TaxID=69656 RepID=A0A650CKL2_SULOH|nr:hypothetical protein [Sulfurisphaera ohwakuensis]MBB5255028.1 hypothetical protein [Sulfurisphaera ohwakuensis]QGR18007.1 hypothetical protein D1869_13045 [Sulfurisphaera ohwakuensis]
MELEICKSDGILGVRLSSGRVISLLNNSIFEINPDRCVKTLIEVKEKEAVFKNLRIPLYLPSEELNKLKLLYVVKGEVSHEIIYYNDSVEIHIDTKLKNVKLTNKISFTRFCGNYGLLLPNYCIGNETFAIFGKNKNEVYSAYLEFKEFIDHIRKILLNLT